MSAKSKLEKLEKLERASLAGNRKLIVAHECLDDRGKYKVIDYEDLGLLSLEEIKKHFEAQDVKILYITYVDNWRGSS